MRWRSPSRGTNEELADQAETSSEEADTESADPAPAAEIEPDGEVEESVEKANAELVDEAESGDGPATGDKPAAQASGDGGQAASEGEASTDDAAMEATAEETPEVTNARERGRGQCGGRRRRTGPGAGRERLVGCTDRRAFSLGGVSRSLGGVFGTASAVLNGVTDAESAEAAVPRLEKASGTLDEVAAQFDNAPESARGPLQRVVDNGLARLRPLVDTVLTRDGVGPVLSPVVEPMVEKLQGLSN